MKVMCIGKKDDGEFVAEGNPIYGCVYNVSGEEYGPNQWTSLSGVFYSLEEFDNDDFFHESMFVPLSGIDETEYSTSDKVIEEVKI